VGGVSAPDGERATSFAEEALPHLDAVYHFALRLSRDPDEARDLAQETYLRAFRSWDRYTPGTRAKSWLFTICRNVFLRRRERGLRHDRIVAEQTPGEDGALDAINPLWARLDDRDPEGEFFSSIVDEEVLRAVDALPEEYRSALVMSDLEGMSYDEIAHAMDVPVGTVKSRLFRARRRLQQTLYEYAVEMGYIRAKEEAER